MMKQPVQDFCGDDIISENFILLAEVSPLGQDQSLSLVASGDELIEEVQADTSDFVYDMNLGWAIELESFLSQVLYVNLAQGCY